MKSHRYLRRYTAVSLAALMLILLLSGSVQAAETDVMDLSLEELLNMEITSVSKKPENRREAPAAVYVITSDDIRRSAATTIPDLLRTVPGVHVARSSSDTWSVTARGDSGEFSNKLLVLIDGRSIYTPLFGGVFWNANDVLLEDVDRIEIVRGPGGTLWGANAVNGVINIVTKHSSETQGGLITAGTGTYEKGFSSLRYGGQMNDDTFYRVYAKYTNRGSGGRNATPYVGIGDIGIKPADRLADDGWDTFQGGFRLDTNLSVDETLLVEGDAYNNNYDKVYNLPFRNPSEIRRIESTTHGYGVNLLARWEKTLSDDSSMHLQGYITHTRFDDLYLGEQETTVDLEFQHRFAWGQRNELVWGLGYRFTRDGIDNTPFYIYSPQRQNYGVVSGFIQNEFAVTDTLKLTMGTKIEYNDYTGVEVQPSARFAWTPNSRHTVWGAVSRAVRTPDRATRNVAQIFAYIPGTILDDGAVILRGSNNLESEDVLSYELGYRVELRDDLFLDVTGFYNEETDMLGSNIIGPFVDPNISTEFEITQYLLNNKDKAELWGFEAVVDWELAHWWDVRAMYSLLKVHPSGGFNDNYPDQIVSLINSFAVTDEVDLDVTVRYVDALEYSLIDDYITADIRLGWRPNEDLELAVVGQNLFDGGRFEFKDNLSFNIPSQVQPGVYGKVTWKF